MFTFQITTSNDRRAFVEAASREAAKAAFPCEAGERVWNVAQVREVADEGEANALFAHLTADCEFTDNYRFAYADDAAGVAAYDQQVEDGCCGSADYLFRIAGRLAWMGLNYGH
jgi:hypothetical protein